MFNVEYVLSCAAIAVAATSKVIIALLLMMMLLLQGHLCGPGALLPGTTNTPSPAGALCNFGTCAQCSVILLVVLCIKHD
jgi:hypothetical protein